MSELGSAAHVLTVVFMGDSITHGQYVASERRWTDLISARLQSAQQTSAVRLACHNRGVSGETTRQGLERYPRDVQSLRPDVMTLQFGLNDCNCWDTDRGLPRVSEAAYHANLVEMVERTRRFGGRQIVLSTNHVTLRHKTLANGRTLESNRIRYNHIVREVAAATNVTLCDIERGFDHFSQAELADLLLPEPDVLHLSDQGHRYYADLIFPFVLAAVQGCITSSDTTPATIV